MRLFYDPHYKADRDHKKIVADKRRDERIRAELRKSLNDLLTPLPPEERDPRTAQEIFAAIRIAAKRAKDPKRASSRKQKIAKRPANCDRKEKQPVAQQEGSGNPFSSQPLSSKHKAQNTSQIASADFRPAAKRARGKTEKTARKPGPKKANTHLPTGKLLPSSKEAKGRAVFRQSSPPVRELEAVITDLMGVEDRLSMLIQEIASPLDSSRERLLRQRLADLKVKRVKLRRELHSLGGSIMEMLAAQMSDQDGVEAK